MRRFLRPAVVILISGMLAACAPGQASGAGNRADATPLPSQGELMIETTVPDTPVPTEELPELPVITEAIETAEPAATPQVTETPEALPASFDAMVLQGLAERWAGRQAIVVRADSEDSPEANVWLYERVGDGWKAAAGPWPAMVGKNGVSKQQEGDGRAPSGVFLLGSAFGWAPSPSGATYQYRKLDSRDRWVDEVSSPYYNRWVRGSASKCGSGEDLKTIAQYEHALIVHYNDAAEAGLGSAIFLHVWLGPGKPTHGCTAMSEQNMETLLCWLDYSARPVLVQGTEQQISKLMGEDWGIACLPDGWGYVDDFIPDAQLEIRYSTASNFTGKLLAGYQSPQAVMRLDAIEALALAAAEWKGDSIGLRVYDAYRPQQATDAMIAWAEDLAETATKKEYYPELDKVDIPGQYVARKSNHRLGGTVDLTLVNWSTGKNIDMGGPFDFFGNLSAYRYKGLSAAQSSNRSLLRSVMMEFGFAPYDKEWWHFAYPTEGAGGDFTILPRERAAH